MFKTESLPCNCLIQDITNAFKVHCKELITKIQNKCSQKRNCASKVPISLFMCLWAIYIFPRSICLFCHRKYVDRSWEYVNRSQTHEEIRTEAAQFPEKEYVKKMGFLLQCTVDLWCYLFNRRYFFLKFQLSRTMGLYKIAKNKFLVCGSLLVKKSVAASSMYKPGTSTVRKSCTGRGRKNNKRRLFGNLGKVAHFCRRQGAYWYIL